MRKYDKISYSKWYKNHAQEKRDKVREAFLALRIQTLDILGNKCSKCGYNKEKRILMVDHVNDNGAAEREENGQSWKYRKQILEKIKSGSKEYQLLCPNCSAIKESDRNIKKLISEIS